MMGIEFQGFDELEKKLEGRNMTMIVAPKAQKSSGKNKKKQQQEKPATQGGNTHAEN